MGNTDKSDCVRFIDATMSIYNEYDKAGTKIRWEK